MMATWHGRKQTTKDKPHEVWQTYDGEWTYRVLKKHQADDEKPFARWFVVAETPYSSGDMGDMYVERVKEGARCIERDGVTQPIGIGVVNLRVKG